MGTTKPVASATAAARKNRSATESDTPVRLSPTLETAAAAVPAHQHAAASANHRQAPPDAEPGPRQATAGSDPAVPASRHAANSKDPAAAAAASGVAQVATPSPQPNSESTAYSRPSSKTTPSGNARIRS